MPVSSKATMGIISSADLHNILAGWLHVRTYSSISIAALLRSCTTGGSIQLALLLLRYSVYNYVTYSTDTIIHIVYLSHWTPETRDPCRQCRRPYRSIRHCRYTRCPTAHRDMLQPCPPSLCHHQPVELPPQCSQLPEGVE